MTITLRCATLDDAQAIHTLIGTHTGENRLLNRSLDSIQKTIDGWIVAEENGELVGCGALADYGKDLCEVRSLVVETRYQSNGLGGKIVRELLAMANERGVKTIFTLTTAVGFFSRQQFEIASRRDFPLKIWRDCINCPVKFRCDEVTMVYKLS